ncbi:MAG: UDP-N-acetylmuramate--L-alanine ligase [Bacteroidota bacterium]
MTNELANIKYVYLLGVGGIGMSALARYFHAAGKKVAGYDKTITPLTQQLESEGVFVHYEDSIDNIPSYIQNVSDKSEVLVILTPAIPKEHQEWNYLVQNNFTIVKRSKVLGYLTEGQTTLAVAGTHGKTTTSTLLAHILHSAGKNTSAFLGGISSNFKSNLLVGRPQETGHQIVVEADEFDRSFLQLFPDVAIITSMDPDHLDIYGNHAEMLHNYRLFAAQVKESGILIYKKGLSVGEVKAKTATYSIEDDSADYVGLNIRVENGFYHFDFKSKSHHLENLVLGLPGRHNVENAVAASAVALQRGVSEEALRNALKSFQGAQRRFDVQVRKDSCVYIDDYAHHPAELKAAILSAKELFPNKKITGVFQPHLFTRTRDFAEGFAQSLSLLDSLIMLDIYPARELPLPGITANTILDKVTIHDKILVEKSALLNEIKSQNPEVLITLGAGDIDQFVEPIKHLLN